MGKEIQLNYIGKVDMNDVGKRRIKLTDLISMEELERAVTLAQDPQFELSVELVTENTNGQLAARIRLVPVQPQTSTTTISIQIETRYNGKIAIVEDFIRQAENESDIDFLNRASSTLEYLRHKSK